MPDNEAGFKMRSYCETGLCSVQRCKTCPSKNNETVNLDWVGLSHRYDVNNFTVRSTVHTRLLTKMPRFYLKSQSNFVKSYLRWRPGLFPPLQLYNWIEAGGLTRTELIKFYNFLTPHKEAQPAQLWLVLHWPPDKLNFVKLSIGPPPPPPPAARVTDPVWAEHSSSLPHHICKYWQGLAELQLIICLL